MNTKPSIKNYIVVILPAVIAVFIIFFLVMPQVKKNRIENNIPSNTEHKIGGDKDEYGCLVAAGYSWCESKQKCLRKWEEFCAMDPSSDDIEAIRKVFMDKYSRNSDEVEIRVDTFNGDYARGGVRFSMDGQFDSGGIFLAYKENETWNLAFDGNGMYSCPEVQKYGFPDEMIPDCANPVQLP